MFGRILDAIARALVGDAIDDIANDVPVTDIGDIW